MFHGFDVPELPVEVPAPRHIVIDIPFQLEAPREVIIDIPVQAVNDEDLFREVSCLFWICFHFEISS